MGGKNWERLQRAATGDAESVVLTLGDDEKIGFGGVTGGDVFARWDGSIFEFLPETDDTGAFNIGDGTYDMDFKVFMDSTAAYFEVDQSAQLVSIVGGYMTIGTTGSPTTQTATGTKAFGVYTTCASTTGNFEPVLFETAVTAATQTGGRVKAYLSVEAAMGGWSNAFKGEVVYTAAGSTAGMGSAICAEMTLSAGTTAGTYAPLEVELTVGASGSLGTKTSLMYFNIGSAGAATFDTGGYFFQIGDGITAAAGKFCSATYQTLKC
ncbi:hypothetical protein HQ535_09590, partial [bacterium]|nr:hypothetical protein [bacterium]